MHWTLGSIRLDPKSLIISSAGPLRPAAGFTIFSKDADPGSHNIDKISVERGAEISGRSMNSKSAGYPRFRLFTPNPPYFFLWVFADGKKTSGSACIDASRLIFQSAVKDPLGCLFFCVQADLKRYSRMKNQSASIDASGAAGFFPVSEHPKKKKSGGLGVNKRNRGYPADFEFIERPLSFLFFCCTSAPRTPLNPNRTDRKVDQILVSERQTDGRTDGRIKHIVGLPD